MKNFVKRFKIEKSYSFKKLTIYPVSLKSIKEKRDILTLDEALKSKYLKIWEKEGGEVNSVIVENLSPKFIFLMAGELLTGCKQDRMVAYDCLLPPHSGKIYLRVYCTEQGRWTEKTKYFKGLNFAVNPKMRQIAKKTKSQSRVWAEIEEKRETLQASPSETGAFQSIFYDKQVQEKTKKYVKNLSDVFETSKDISGVVIVIGDEIICSDIFGYPSLFRKFWPKLLKGYVLEALDKEKTKSSISQENIENFLYYILKADYQLGETDGVGKALEIESNKIEGSALIYTQRVVHLDLFPQK
ncbi:MAG: ARPP-1 family domain-containing protein [Candidatus Aminicenantia bacterium]